jgi:co-chaperonin GroES (HSP10)
MAKYKLDGWMRRIRPHGTQVCIVLENEARQTSGGIHLPDGMEAGPGHGIGRVFAVGPGENHPINGFVEPSSQVGTVVCWIRNDRIQELTLDGHKWYCVDDKDVLATILADYDDEDDDEDEDEDD